MVTANAWTETKCKIDNCVLGLWRPQSQYCYFHEDDPAYANDRFVSEAQSHFSKLRNPSSVDKGNWEPDTLLIKSVRLRKEYLQKLRRSIQRAVVFESCDFENSSFFQNNSFSKRVEFRYCTFPKHELADSAELSIVNCTFSGPFVFMSLDTSVTCFDCTFGRMTEFVSFELPIPGVNRRRSVRLVRCILAAKEGEWLSCDGELSLDGFIAPNRFVYDGQGKRLTISGSRFEKTSTISLDNESHLRLHSNDIYEDMLLTGERILPSPKIEISEMRQWKGSRLTFGNLDLSSLSSEDYTFEHVAFENVHFPSTERRPIFETETKWRQGKYTESTIPTSKAVLEYLQESYKNLKLYFDQNSNYHTANCFHAGELWAQWQLDILNAKRGWRRIFNRYASWHALYYWVSAFGQSWLRPEVWLLFIFLTCWLIYSIIGYYPIDRWWNFYDSAPWRIWQGLKVAGRHFAFWIRADSPLVPFHWMGYVVGFLQTSLTLIIGTFFLLALRRRFKR